jgi:PAS domain S-box-containing protein
MANAIRILLLEDQASDSELVARTLTQGEILHEFRVVQTQSDFVRELREYSPDVILSDFTLPQFDGLTALRLAQSNCPDVPFIFVSGTISEEAAIEALAYGASDYILKSSLARLPTVVRRVLREADDRMVKHRAEQARVKAEELYSSVVELSSEAILLLHDGKITLINPAGLQLYGAEKHVQIVGKPFLDLVHADSRQEAAVWLNSATSGGKSARVQQKHVKRDGAVLKVDLRCSRLEKHGETVTLVLVRPV